MNFQINKRYVYIKEMENRDQIIRDLKTKVRRKDTYIIQLQHKIHMLEQALKKPKGFCPDLHYINGEYVDFNK